MTSDLGSVVERLLSDRRVVMGGLIAGGVIMLGSLALGAYGGPTRSSRETVSVLPETPLNIPIIRQLPQPQPRKAGPLTAQR